MIKVYIGTNTDRNEVIVNENNSLKEILDANDINYNYGTIQVDGAIISMSKINDKISSLGAEDGSYILVVAKADNA